ncbi:NB-ARC domain-containing protein [Roseofilum casamattae]|uniref:NB-ARC domain-containing protein n=1 Tax=Roseofilum casamattae BLCC-M143 TaxID=3022442 RepID=A0ABT7BQZ3_9CYAN|nr:NB-ARC domain-containing protein [Roseofilum casamattae]MDJ1181617.1 NB-ARC domain-containing protein [Roseofilum casamattae BLCC-M143]
MDFIKERKYRLLGSAALLVGGTICGGPLGGAVGSVVAGMIANDVVPQHLENLTVRLRDSREQLGNGDLTEAVGLAIGLLIKARAEDGTFPESKYELVSLAKYAVKHWSAIAKELQTAGNANFAKIQDTQALGLFSQALGSEPVLVLEEADWVQLLQEMQQQVEMQLPSQIVRQLALDLQEKFAFALREVLKADFSGDGKAFGGLVISMLGAIHARLENIPVAPESQQEVAKAVKTLKKETKKLRKDKARFRKFARKLDGGIEQILGKLETTEDILNSLQVWLQGELSQISEKLDKIQDTVSGNSKKLDRLIGTSPGSTSVGNSLPQTNHWQGREKELQTVHRWLDDDNRKLGIIVGIAGMGKSALAAKVYRQRRDFVRKYWAELGKPEPPKFVNLARQVLRELVRVSQDILKDTADAQLREMLVQGLQQRRFLLVLDNFESVVSDADYREFLQRWLNCCHQTEILVTTQVELKLFWGAKPQILTLQRGLSSGEGAQLLAARDVEETEEEREQFSRKVSGHPLTLCLVAGMLGAQRGEQRITLADLTTDIGQAIEQLQGSHRQEDDVPLLAVLDRCFRRLSKVWRRRLLLLTVLRQGFDRTLVEAMVGEIIADEELPNLAIQGFLVALEKKNLQERQHYEFQQIILEYLQCRAGDVTEAHQRAVAVYRSCCRMPEDWKMATVEDVQDYLELFYHLCQLGEYEQAFDAIHNTLGAYEQSVSQFLHIRGYNSLRTQLYQQVKPYLSNQLDQKLDKLISNFSLIDDRIPPITHWQGRVSEVQKVHQWLDDDNRHLSIIVGIAGIGKSALAAVVYRQRNDFVRKYWVDLLERPMFATFARQVLQGLVQVPQDTMEQTPDTRLSDMLIETLQQQRFLLVLNNFELVSADKDYREFLQRWLNYCHRTQILVTTQQQPEFNWVWGANILSLSGLSVTESVQLLQALSIEVELEELQAYAEKTNGHPLTLRLVAGMLQNEWRNERT